jgi:hypothetical protein
MAFILLGHPGVQSTQFQPAPARKFAPLQSGRKCLTEGRLDSGDLVGKTGLAVEPPLIINLLRAGSSPLLGTSFSYIFQ